MHCRAMVAQDQYLANVSWQPSVIAYGSGKIRKGILVKSKVSSQIQRYPNKEVKGMAKYGGKTGSASFISIQEVKKVR